MHLINSALSLCFLLAQPLASAEPTQNVSVDLLVVGSSESAVSAAVQAARLCVPRVLLVSDIAWLGGQFSAEGCGAIDEWTVVQGKRVEFPRSGMFLEVVRAIEASNEKKYGTKSPGNCFCARLTVEPKDGARISEELVAPEVKAGRLRIERGWVPTRVQLAEKRVTAVEFQQGDRRLSVSAKLTIDASDWGDIIRLSGAGYFAGPDPKSRFDEPSAPAEITEANRREMNPLTYCVTLRGSEKASVVPKPEGFDRRNYLGVSRETAQEFAAVGWPKGVLKMNVPLFADTVHKEGPYSPPVNVYTHRRLVDALHRGRPITEECLFLNWPVQDYPLDHWPKAVVEALEKTEAGASRKNIVELTPAQRELVLADAKRHSLGLLHHLQTESEPFRKLHLTDEYGTSDQLPWKPYIREGLRLHALTMLREQDLRTPHPEPRWAKLMPTDGVFGFQFNIDFHPTRRQFLRDDPAGPWATIHTATRNWNTHTDRSLFPLRGLIPLERDGLLGAGKNIGVSSIVSSALRLQGQMMLCGQAAGTVAYLAWKERCDPRALAADPKQVRALQRLLLEPKDKPGVLLWPYHDLPPEHPAFLAANVVTLAGIWQADVDSVFFQPDQAVTTADWQAACARVPEPQRAKLDKSVPKNRADAVCRLFACLEQR